MAKIIPLNNLITRLDIPIDNVLEVAKEKLKDVVLIGWDVNDELYCASNLGDGADIL